MDTCLHAKPIDLHVMKNAVRAFAGWDRSSCTEAFQTGEQKTASVLFRTLQLGVLPAAINSMILLALRKEVLYDQHYKNFTIESIKEKEEKAF